MSEPSVRVLLVGGLPDTSSLREQLCAASPGLLDISDVNRLDQAMERLDCNSFDLLLLDCPVLDTDLVEEIRALRRQSPIPIIWLTCSGNDLLGSYLSQNDLTGVAVENRDNPKAILRTLQFSILREQNQRYLQESEERYRIACEASHALVYDINLTTGRATFLHGLKSLLGYEPEEESPTRGWWFSQIHKVDLPIVRAKLQEAFSRGRDYSIQYRIRHQNGTYIVVEDSGRSLVDQDGQAIRCVGSVIEITQRIQAADALRESERRYHELVDELEGIVEERTADLWAVNQMLEMITECSKTIVRTASEEELLKEICRIIVDLGGYELAWIGFAQQDQGKTISPVSQAGEGGVCLQCMRMSWAEDNQSVPAGEAIRIGKTSFDCGLRETSAGQSSCSYRSSIALPLGSEADVFGALVICSSQASAFDRIQSEIMQELADDLAFGITAIRTRAELDKALMDLEQRSLQLRALASELTQAEERERKRLAQALHDDLQQILVAAKFGTDTLAHTVRNTQQIETAEQVSQLLVQAIESARSLSFELSPPILYDAGLARALHYLGKRMEAKHGLAVSVEADEEAEPESEEIRVMLFQSARELLFNVVKHAKVRNAQIEMRRLNKDFVRVSISDSGIGFDPDKLKMESSQNGFGLFSIRGRLDLIGGGLEIQSAPGNGSRFTMTAPISKSTGGQPPVPRSPAKPKGGLLRAGRKPQKDRVLK